MSPKTELVNKAVADRKPTPLHENMAKWLTETTGYEADLKTVQLVASLRLKFQQSEINQNDLKARREAAEKRLEERARRAHERNEAAAKKAEELAAKSQEKITKTVSKAKKEAAVAAETVADPFDPEAPMIPLEEKPKAKRGDNLRTTKTAAKPAKARAPRRPAKA